MNVNRFRLFFFCLALSRAVVAEPAPSLSPAAVQRIDAAVEAWESQRGAPALSLAIVGDNQLAFSKGYGLADLEMKIEARNDTVYRLASLTSSLTATAVAQLVEEGKLDLEAPVQNYCPIFPEKQWPVTSRNHSGGRHEMTPSGRFPRGPKRITYQQHDQT